VWPNSGQRNADTAYAYPRFSDKISGIHRPFSKINPTGPDLRYTSGTVNKFGSRKEVRGMAAAETFRALLDMAYAEFAAGDAAEAERRARAVSAIVRAERDVAEFIAAATQAPEEDAETIRAELRSRFRRLVEAEHAGAPDEVLERIATGTPQT
jgi:hypothetical protein